VISSRAGRSACPAAVSSDTVPRTKARQPSARSGRARSKLSCWRISAAWASIRSPAISVAVTVTPRAIANGIASPSL
jgi:hypothetical protein